MQILSLESVLGGACLLLATRITGKEKNAEFSKDWVRVGGYFAVRAE